MSQEHEDVALLLDEQQLLNSLNGMPSSMHTKFLAEQLFPHVQVRGIASYKEPPNVAGVPPVQIQNARSGAPHYACYDA